MSSKFYETLARERDDSPDLQQCIGRTVDQLLKLDTSAGRPGILLGKIQSGKTRAFLGVIADAFDKGYELAVVLTKGTVSLAEQTMRRIEKDFGSFIQADKVQVFDIMSLPTNLTKYHLNQKLILVVKKEDDNLKRLFNALKSQYPQLSLKKLLIIDDEADFASVTLRKANGEITLGVISQKIDELRSLVTNSSFLQVTATPYSLYLQPEKAVLKDGQPLFKPRRPAFTELLPIHPHYVGGDYYFEKNSEPDSPAYYFYEEVPMPERETLKKQDGRRLTLESVLTEKNVRILRRAIMNFVVGAAIRRLQQERAGEPTQKYSLLVHTEQSRDAHTWQENIITQLRNQLEEAASKNTSVFRELLGEAYEDIEKSVKVAGSEMPGVTDLEKNVRDALAGQFLQITKVNSDGDVKDLLDSEGQLKLSTPMSLFIGGQILDRGVTIRNLIGFYYGRNPQKYQQDTVLQHSRMYGARPQADLSVTRLYAPRQTYQVMQKIHQFDSALREGFLNKEYDQGVYFIQKDPKDKLVPCSPNRLLFSKLTSIRPGGRLLPVGFQTVYKSYGNKRLDELDRMMAKVYGTQYGKVLLISLIEALHLAQLAFANMEYDPNEDYDDERKGLLASLEHLSIHATHPHNKGKVGLIAQVSREIEREHDGRISNSPDSYQEKGVARQAANDIPVLLMLRQNGKQSGGWRDLPFWWPVIFVPETAVTSVFAAEGPPTEEPQPIAPSVLGALESRANAYLEKHLGQDQPWGKVSKAIWGAVRASPNHILGLSEIDSIAHKISSDENDVLAVLALLSRPDAALLTMSYQTDSEKNRVPNDEVIRRLRAWWRDKSLSDTEWEEWANRTTVEWSPVSISGETQ
jgi:hypothetical protein